MDKIYRVLFFLLVLLTGRITANAQYENVWAFGDSAGINFNTGIPVPIITSTNTIEGSASVCDANGQLLFYTEGTLVWDRNHQLMPNGSDLAFSTISFPNATPTDRKSVV